MLDPIEVTRDDSVERFFLLSNSHDGRGALSLRFTPVRVVCQNTLNLATKGGENVVNIRHSRNMRDRLTDEQVAVLLKLIAETFSRAADDFRALAVRKVTAEEKTAYLEALIPRTAMQRSANELPLRWKMVDKALEDDTVSPKSTRDTLWTLYNAVTRVEDYRAPPQERDGEARLSRVWFGASADLKIKALQKAVEMCG
jgi:phage/plasmid-like protein (TIGR03299 family)